MEISTFCKALKDERIRRDFTIEEIALRSNIPAKVLNALESGEVDQIPGRFYIRSFLRSYLRAVGADDKDFFLKHHQEIDALTREKDVQKMVSFSKLRYKRFKSRKMIYLMIGLVIVLILLFMLLPQAQPLRAWLGVPEGLTVFGG